MAELKREYVVPLRRKIKFAPKWRRSKKAIAVLKDFIRKHMKVEDVIVCKELNEQIWENGSKNPPGKVSVVVLKTSVKGAEKAIVNLASAGVEKQKELYAVPQEEQTQKVDSSKEETASEEPQEAEVTQEVKKQDSSQEEELEEDDKNKKEVKKDE